MKKYTLIFLVMLLGLSCSKHNVPQKSAAELNSVPVRAENSEANIQSKALVEREERLVEVNEAEIAEALYFVIIGSFRNKENAMKYQEEIGEKGFASILLKNEEGYYRISVKATGNIEEARNEIHRIRKNYPRYSDTWLLIRKK